MHASVSCCLNVINQSSWILLSIEKLINVNFWMVMIGETKTLQNCQLLFLDTEETIKENGRLLWLFQRHFSSTSINSSHFLLDPLASFYCCRACMHALLFTAYFNYLILTQKASPQLITLISFPKTKSKEHFACSRIKHVRSKQEARASKFRGVNYINIGFI